jgi:hypothetical protein
VINRLALVDLRGGPERALTPQEGPDSFGPATFAPDGWTIYLPTNGDRDRSTFGRIRLGDDDKPGPIEVIAAREDAELSGLAVDDQGRTAALVWNVAGRSELALVDLATGSVTPGPIEGRLQARLGCCGTSRARRHLDLGPPRRPAPPGHA